MFARLKTAARRRFDDLVREQQVRAADMVARHGEAGRIGRRHPDSGF